MNSNKHHTLAQVMIVALMAAVSLKTATSQAQTTGSDGHSDQIIRLPGQISPVSHALEGRYFRWSKINPVRLMLAASPIINKLPALKEYDLELSVDCRVKGKAYAQTGTITWDQSQLSESGSLVFKIKPLIVPMIHPSPCRQVQKLVQALNGKLHYKINGRQLVLFNARTGFKMIMDRDNLNFPMRDPGVSPESAGVESGFSE